MTNMLYMQQNIKNILLEQSLEDGLSILKGLLVKKPYEMSLCSRKTEESFTTPPNVSRIVAAASAQGTSPPFCMCHAKR